MARSISLSRTLPRLTTPTRLTTIRSQSTTRIDTAIPKTKEELERAAINKLEEAIHNMIVKKAQPDWLPLVPGASYWVPPNTKSRGFAHVLSNLLHKEVNQTLLRSNRGWPSSAQFFIGESHSPLEGEMTSKQPSQSEEEG